MIHESVHVPKFIEFYIKKAHLIVCEFVRNYKNQLRKNNELFLNVEKLVIKNSPPKSTNYRLD